MHNRTVTLNIETLRISGLGRREADRLAADLRTELTRQLSALVSQGGEKIAPRQAERETAAPSQLSRNHGATASDVAHRICAALMQQRQSR